MRRCFFHSSGSLIKAAVWALLRRFSFVEPSDRTPESPAAGEGTGTWGEDAAAEWLARRGYEILARNYRCRAGEIDLVAGKNGIVAFVEVKTRGPRSIARPAAFVNAKKRRRIGRAASLWLKRFPSRPPRCRFDVVEVEFGAGRRVIRHLRGAFRAGD